VRCLSGAAALLAWLVLSAGAPSDADFDAAKAFGAREGVTQLSLSPDGKRIAFIAPAEGQRSILYTVSTEEGAQPRAVLDAKGEPERLRRCDWVSDSRLICQIYGVIEGSGEVAGYSSLVAVDAAGGNQRILSNNRAFYGGEIVDWLPHEQGVVLMRRRAGVERIDTSTLKTTLVEPYKKNSCDFLSDGRGKIRLIGLCRTWTDTNLGTPVIDYFMRSSGPRAWVKIFEYDQVAKTGFDPRAIDPDRNVVYGLMKKAGRMAAYEMPLDTSTPPKLLYAHPDVDVDDFVYLGRERRVVGVRYSTDISHVAYFDPGLDKMRSTLSRTLPQQPSIEIVDSSSDETRLLVFASGDRDAGVYYLLDRSSKRMTRLMAARPQLDGQKLAAMKPISYTATDGTRIPAYLTLPEGGGQNLPAIVLPHGGPAARDRWGFDWLPQYFAARGYAVLQPQFRGSAGYGDDWFQKNGFQSWRAAVGDVRDAGRWLVAQGIADPGKLGIIGWSYGGYAALQSAVIDPGLFKAVVAIAPVTDLASLKSESDFWANRRMVRDFIGSGPHIREGSPAQNAAQIRVPVLMFHGGLDRNVRIAESQLMLAKLRAAGASAELVTWEKLDHQIEDGDARASMLRKSDEFMRKAMGM
jgi:acetyl esterase/lipase